MKSRIRILMAVVLLATLLAPLPGQADDQPDSGVPVAVEAAGRGNPWINLRDGVALPAAYDGPGAAVQAMADGQAQPLSLAAADFDRDGLPDLVAGYAGPGGGGLLTLYRGNVDSIYPPDPEAFTEAAFLTPARVFEAPAAPDFLAAGDFDNDGHPDVVLAARGEAMLNLLPGDGQGGFGQAQGLPLPGGVTALLAGEVNRRDGLADLAVGIDGPDGAQGNRIGSGDPGAGPGQGNGQHGIYLWDVSGNTVGGTATGAGNLIAGNGGAGVYVQFGASANAIRGNSIYGNGGLGIDLTAGNVADGPAANDPGDEDSGPNNLQNWPEIHAVAIQGDQVQVTLRVDTRPGWGARYPLEIDFYDAEGSVPYLQGKTYLGTVSYLEGEAQTLVTRTFTVQPPVPLASGVQAAAAPNLIVATATDADGNTSEFSWPVSPRPVVVNSTGDGYDPDLGDDVCWTGGYTGGGARECTLRAAIETANARAGFDAITFDIPGGGVPTFRPQSALPPLQEAVLLDGSSQPGGTVELDGSGAGAGVDGLYLDSNGSSVRGLVVNRFGGHGIVIAGDGNALLSNIIGADAAGAVEAANGDSGIYLNNGAGNLIGGVGSGNLVSGNRGHGVELRYANTTGNRLLGNTVGLDASGTSKLGNTKSGVFLDSAAHDNVVGGISSSGEGNVISGNGGHGIYLDSSIGNQILGNTIGPRADRASDLTGNRGNGVYVAEGSDNLVGGSAAGAGNFISGNGGHGVEFFSGGALAEGNRVEGNQIGAIEGSLSDWGGNEGSGVFIYQVRDTHLVGNVVTRNGGWGVEISDPGATGNQLQGNLIGTDKDGSFLPNWEGGVFIGSASNTMVGGTTMAARNVVSGNNGSGVVVMFGFNNTVQGNVISGHTDEAYGVQLGPATRDNEILGNQITDNGNAMDDQGRNVVVGNVIQGALPSRLRCTDCKSQIAGNRFGPNGGVVVSITGAPAVHKNNLEVSSAGLSKESPYPDPPPLTASAQDNWWGEPDGPGGEGPGSGAPVSLYVDYAPWRTGPVALAAVAAYDTLYGSPNAAAGQARLPHAGGVVTNRLFFQNWTHPTDTLAVTLQDTRGWLVSLASFTVAMTDGLGASALVSVVVPAGTPLGTTDWVTVTAVSSTDPALVDTATFQVVSALVADLAVVKQGRGQATPGQPFVYDLTVTNAGPDAADGVVLTDTLPLTLTFLSAGASQGSCEVEGGLVVCQLGALANGGQATVAVTVVPAARGEVVNVAEVSADEPDPARYNNVAVEYTRVSHRAYLPLVQKSAP